MKLRQFRQRELLDAEDVDPAALGRALRFIRLVNNALGYNAATLRALEPLTQPWRVGTKPRGHEGSEITVLDIATGSADLPQQIGRWARRRGLAIRIVGLDLHRLTLGIARQWAPEIPLVRGDALRLPFADESFDLATCGMFLHHLPTEAAVAVIGEMERVSRRGWIVADLLRRRRALAWISLFTLFAGRLERHDAGLSVKQAFSPAEARRLAIDAGVAADYREVFGHRFLLVRDKRRS